MILGESTAWGTAMNFGRHPTGFRQHGMMLQQVGTKRWTVYRLTSTATQSTEEEDRRVAATVGRRATGEERRERIFEVIAARGPVSTRAIVEQLGISRATVQYYVRTLLDEGRVERTTDDPNAPHVEYRVKVAGI